MALLVAGTFVNHFGSFVLVFLVLCVKHLGHSTAAAGTYKRAFVIDGVAIEIASETLT